MSALPPGDRATNLRLIAERLGWPDGARDACNALEEMYESWIIFWTSGGLPRDPRRGFRAVLVMQGHRCHLYGETIDQLRWLVAVADAKLPREEWPAHLTPLV